MDIFDSKLCCLPKPVNTSNHPPKLKSLSLTVLVIYSPILTPWMCPSMSDGTCCHHQGNWLTPWHQSPSYSGLIFTVGDNHVAFLLHIFSVTSLCHIWIAFLWLQYSECLPHLTQQLAHSCPICIEESRPHWTFILVTSTCLPLMDLTPSWHWG